MGPLHGTILPPVKGDKFHLFEFSVLLVGGSIWYHISIDMEIEFLSPHEVLRDYYFLGAKTR